MMLSPAATDTPAASVMMMFAPVLLPVFVPMFLTKAMLARASEAARPNRRASVRGGTIMRRCRVAIGRRKRTPCPRPSEPAPLLAAKLAVQLVEGAMGRWRRSREQSFAVLPRGGQRRVDDHRPLEGHGRGRQP